MKKYLSLFLSLALVLCAVGAAAQSTDNVVRFVEDSHDFDIQMPLPEGASVLSTEGADDLSITRVGAEGLATVRINIAPTDTFDKESMNDLTDEDIEALGQLAASQYENPEITVEETLQKNKFIHICSNDQYDIDAIFTLYMGYFIEMTQWHDDYSPLSEADYAFMRQLLYNLEFIPEK